MKEKTALPILQNLMLVLAASVCFFLAHPNFIFSDGLGLLVFFLYFPILILVHRCSLKSLWIYGGLFGALSYLLFAYWLVNYHFITLILVCLLYFFLYALLLTGLKISELLFKEYSWIVSFLFVAAFEYLKSLGFLGFSYGTSAYALWKFRPLIQSASIFGVFGLNLLVLFPSFYIFSLFLNKRKRMLAGGIWIFLFTLNAVFGVIVEKSGKNFEYKNVIAVQNNESSWKNGLSEHQKNIDNLINLTEKALKENPETDFVIWPETAVAPSIIHHFYSMEDMGRLKLVLSLLDYMNSKDCIFVIGNAHEEYLEEKKIYNDAMVFIPRENVIPPEPERYSKIHLVPISESFPYKKVFPHIYDALLKANTHFWEKGSQYTVFNERNLAFSTPICFEDTFGNDCRHFVKNGARAFFNLSNDSWSESLACQKQHLSMAVFRSVENRVPSVRSTSSGQTCVINQYGKITGEVKAFTQGYVAGKVPVISSSSENKLTFYTRYGDYAGIMEVFLSLGLLIIKGIVCIIKKNNRGLHGRKK